MELLEKVVKMFACLPIFGNVVPALLYFVIFCSVEKIKKMHFSGINIFRKKQTSKHFTTLFNNIIYLQQLQNVCLFGMKALFACLPIFGFCTLKRQFLRKFAPECGTWNGEKKKKNKNCKVPKF